MSDETKLLINVVCILLVVYLSLLVINKLQYNYKRSRYIQSNQSFIYPIK